MSSVTCTVFNKPHTYSVSYPATQVYMVAGHPSGSFTVELVDVREDSTNWYVDIRLTANITVATSEGSYENIHIQVESVEGTNNGVIYAVDQSSATTLSLNVTSYSRTIWFSKSSFPTVPVALYLFCFAYIFRSYSGGLTYDRYNLNRTPEAVLPLEYSKYKYWTGTQYKAVGVNKVKRWNGTSYVAGKPKRWDSTQWTNIT